MPSNVVKTKEDEKKWKKAKEKAEEQGKGDNYAYIMSIYKNMNPDYFKDKSSSLESCLIRLGYAYPDLRPDLAVLLDSIKTASKKSFYRTMSFEGLKNLVEENELRPYQRYLSFSDTPIASTMYGDVVVEFPGHLETYLTPVVYEKEWFMEHPDIARYVVGNDIYGNPSPEELAEKATEYSHENEWLADKKVSIPKIESVRVLNPAIEDKVRDFLKYIPVKTSSENFESKKLRCLVDVQRKKRKDCEEFYEEHPAYKHERRENKKGSSGLSYNSGQFYYKGNPISKRQAARYAGNAVDFAYLVSPDLDEKRAKLDEIRDRKTWKVFDPEGNLIVTTARISNKIRSRYPQEQGFVYEETGPHPSQVKETERQFLEAEDRWLQARKEWEDLLETGDLEFQVEKASSGGFYLNLIEDGHRVGYITVIRHRGELEEECRIQYEVASKKLGFEPKVYVVWSTHLSETLRGRGLGVDMYVKAVEALAKQKGVLMPELCMEDFGSTSQDAKRVWNSSRFKSQVKKLDKWVAWGG